MRRPLAAVAAVLLLAASAVSPAAAAPAAGEAAKFVKTLGDEAIRLLGATDIDAGQRRQQYRNLLEAGFAVDTIARFVLGRYWRAANEQQRAEYLGLFREFVLDTYASRLDNYAGETFEIVGAQPLDEKDTIVTTEIRASNGPPIRVDYRVRLIDGGYKIVDVVIEGVSLITTQRAEFASIVNRRGIEGLLALLRERTQSASAN
jgi:phospholipid transport system substrate-binding protein